MKHYNERIGDFEIIMLGIKYKTHLKENN